MDATNGLGLTRTQYYTKGAKFLAVQTDAISGASLPVAALHMPVGQTSFGASDFTVSSGAKQLTIKYNVTDEEARNTDFAGNKLIGATISYKDTSGIVVTKKPVADITAADGVSILNLDEAKSYTISIAIDGQTTDLPLGDYSPAAAPNAVASLKADGSTGGQLTVSFTASINNGEYKDVTPTYKSFVYTVNSDGSKKYVASQNGITRTTNSFVVSSLDTGVQYTVEIESTFAKTGDNTEQKVSAYAQGTPRSLPTIKDFSLDGANKTATLIVDLKGAILNTVLLLTNTGSVLNMSLASAGVALAQSNAIRDSSKLYLSMSVPAGVTNAVAIVANSQGVAWSGSPSGSQGAATITDASLRTGASYVTIAPL